MNVALAASLAIGGAVIGSVAGFFAGLSNRRQLRALAALDAQRSFREVVGALEMNRVPLDSYTQARIAETAEGLAVLVAETSRAVYGDK